jgi:hypothetical protein
MKLPNLNYKRNQIQLRNLEHNGTEECFTVPPTKQCFTMCRGRESIYEAILGLRDSIDNINLKLDSQEEQISVVMGAYKENKAYEEEQLANVRKSHAEAKAKTVGQMAGPSSKMSGLSKSETREALNNHLSKPVTMGDLHKTMKNIPQTSDKQIYEHNKKSAEVMDGMKSPKAGNGEKTSNNYVNKNKAKAKCPGNPALEKEIVNMANEAGYKHIDDKSSSKKRKAAKRVATATLINLCKIHNCTPVNPGGMYPHTIMTMNKKSQGKHPPRTRPKGYRFPT